MLDHELIEYLLTLTIPRIDTKPIAKRLLDQFGGIGPLLATDAETLKREGLSDAALEACTHRARIPMTNAVDSLNVATAAAIALYELHQLAPPSPRLWRDSP